MDYKIILSILFFLFAASFSAVKNFGNVFRLKKWNLSKFSFTPLGLAFNLDLTLFNKLKIPVSITDIRGNVLIDGNKVGEFYSPTFTEIKANDLQIVSIPVIIQAQSITQSIVNIVATGGKGIELKGEISINELPGVPFFLKREF